MARKPVDVVNRCAGPVDPTASKQSEQPEEQQHQTAPEQNREGERDQPATVGRWLSEGRGHCRRRRLVGRHRSQPPPTDRAIQAVGRRSPRTCGATSRLRHVSTTWVRGPLTPPVPTLRIVSTVPYRTECLAVNDEANFRLRPLCRGCVLSGFPPFGRRPRCRRPVAAARSSWPAGLPAVGLGDPVDRGPEHAVPTTATASSTRSIMVDAGVEQLEAAGQQDHDQRPAHDAAGARWRPARRRRHPGSAPIRSEAVRSNWKSPNSRWPSEAEATSGTACTRSVPTSWPARMRRVEQQQRDDHQRAGADRGHADDQAAEDAESRVGSGRTWTASTGTSTTSPAAAAARAAAPCAGRAAPWRSSRPPRTAARRPRAALTTVWVALAVAERAQHQHAEERRRHRAEDQPLHQALVDRALRRCTAPPTGFMIIEATRSLDTAASGWMPNSRIIIGVIRAPPPMPVRPTTKPTKRPAMATAHQPGPRALLRRLGCHVLHLVGGESAMWEETIPGHRPTAWLGPRTGTPGTTASAPRAGRPQGTFGAIRPPGCYPPRVPGHADPEPSGPDRPDAMTRRSALRGVAGPPSPWAGPHGWSSWSTWPAVPPPRARQAPAAPRRRRAARRHPPAVRRRPATRRAPRARSRPRRGGCGRRRPQRPRRAPPPRRRTPRCCRRRPARAAAARRRRAAPAVAGPAAAGPVQGGPASPARHCRGPGSRSRSAGP